MRIGAHALVVDAELQVRRLLRMCLEAENYRVHEAQAGMEAIEKAAQLRPDVIILEMVLPDMDGLEVLRRLREWTNTPTVILSARDGDREKVAALNAGADDYITKPFSAAELMARLRVAQRHISRLADDQLFVCGEVQVDLARRVVTRSGQIVKLTPTEYALLRLLIQHAGRVLTHKQILKEVWGLQYVEKSHYLRVYFAQLRQKLEADSTNPRLIVTIPGVGYRLDPDP